MLEVKSWEKDLILQIKLLDLINKQINKHSNSLHKDNIQVNNHSLEIMDKDHIHQTIKTSDQNNKIQAQEEMHMY